VTPDLCIQAERGTSIVAEAKFSFPNNQEHWADDFSQLMKYDDDLLNWLTANGKVDLHEIALIVHQTRLVKVNEYYEAEKSAGRVRFQRGFAIIEFSNSDMRQKFLFFRTMSGHSISADQETATKLHDGVSVPMEKMIGHYSTCKLYDSAPPTPYLLYLLWENVVFRRVADSLGPDKLRKRKKMAVQLTTDEIVQELHENFSFKRFNGADDEHQPKIPQASWVREALNVLVNAKMAKWLDGQHQSIEVQFQKFPDAKGALLDLWLEFGNNPDDNDRQLALL
jgi:hypothetical protein